MPKLLVLFQSHSSDVVRLAEAAADGVRSVRFAEVDLRRPPAHGDAPHAPTGDGRVHRALEHAEDIAPYDGLLLAVGDDLPSAEVLTRALDAIRGSLANRVGCVLTTATGPDRRTVLWSVLGPMGDRGMILVPAPFGDDGATEASARALGKRVAEVVGWVTHARSHHHHEHDHGHQSHHHQ